MLISPELIRPVAEPPAEDIPGILPAELEELLLQGFGVEFAVLNGKTGEVLRTATDQPARDWAVRSELCREVARRGRAEFLDDEEPFLMLAIPVALPEGNSRVAVATFVTRPVRLEEDLSRAALAMGMQPEEAASWATRQAPWSAEALRRMGELVLSHWKSRQRVAQLEEENDDLSDHLTRTYEEISLLYRLTQNLKISASDEDLGRVALEWLQEVLPVSGLAIQFAPVAQEDESLSHEARTKPVLLTYGDCPIQYDHEFTALIEHLGPGAANRPVVVNDPVTGCPDWPNAQVRQMIAVALAEGENVFGWLAAFNHVENAEFGTVEASLLNSVAAILGIHSGNINLYRQQSELLAGIIRALTSAIDAKDPYTCGHSDRVARIAVRLAEELGCDPQTLNTIYLSGLLHDIGKIGIDDSVLRKPGKLTDEEYEHIKRHVEIGHKILLGLGKLDAVLPVILHHHESWDGGGYPHKLDADGIPFSARIVAVADAFDAMGSDRPYRKGMPDEKIDQIFRNGSGQQWDPEVVDALFRARDDLREITRSERQSPELDLQHWT
ncbi:MAG TPA: HD-GYP domain-containing protein [Thermoguttaceae bacterium]|nr:HD-GYP domain-containing protein [Thermoguttaceae bacterium]